MIESLEGLEEDAGLLFEFAHRMDDLLGEDWPQALTPADGWTGGDGKQGGNMSSAARASSVDPSALAGWTAGTWTIDPAHTVVAFAARHLMSRVRGTFSQVNGKIVTGRDPALCSATAAVTLPSVRYRALTHDDLRQHRPAPGKWPVGAYRQPDDQGGHPAGRV